MKDDIIYNKFKNFLETYNTYFISNEELWNNNLEKVIKYINEKQKLPSTTDKDVEINMLGKWLSSQNSNYKNMQYCMKDMIIYNKFKDFLETYKEYFISNEELWNNNLENVIKYINENQKLPSGANDKKYICSLGRWLYTQKKNYKIRKEIMKEDIIYNRFKDFLEKYKEYLLSNEEIWFNTLEKVKKYINENNKRPSSVGKDYNIKILGCWINHQQNNYKTKSKSMKDEIIYNKWTSFITEYKSYFSNDE